MRHATTTLVLGVTFGIVGVMIYNHLRAAVVEEDPEALLEKLSKRLQDLERRATAVVVRTSTA